MKILIIYVPISRSCTDLNCTKLLPLLVEFVYELVCGGQLYLAKVLRKNIVEKVGLILFYPGKLCNLLFVLG